MAVVGVWRGVDTSEVRGSGKGPQAILLMDTHAHSV